MDFAGIVRDRLAVMRLSKHRAAVDAELPQDAIRNVLNGHVPRLDRAEAICQALELELHIGPLAPSPSAKQGPETQKVLHLSAGGIEVEYSLQELNRVAARAGYDPIPEDLRRQATSGQKDAPSAREIHVVELDAAAGAGAAELGEKVVGQVWFRRDWLDQNGLDPGQCRVIRVRGESMEPTLPDGCSILVDLSRHHRRRYDGRIYVIQAHEGLVVKRAVRTDAGWQIASDHPAWEAIPWPDDADVVGRVRWMGTEL